MKELWQRVAHLPRRVALGMVVGACVVGYGMGLAAGWPPRATGSAGQRAGGGIGVTPAPTHASPTPAPRATGTPSSQSPVFIVPPDAATAAPASLPSRRKPGAGKNGHPPSDGHGHGGGHGHGHRYGHSRYDHGGHGHGGGYGHSK